MNYILLACGNFIMPSFFAFPAGDMFLEICSWRYVLAARACMFYYYAHYAEYNLFSLLNEVFPKDSRNNILTSKLCVSAKLNKCKVQCSREDNVVGETMWIMEYEIVERHGISSKSTNSTNYCVFFKQYLLNHMLYWH
jgi:hypothetical protein